MLRIDWILTRTTMSCWMTMMKKNRLMVVLCLDFAVVCLLQDADLLIPRSRLPILVFLDGFVAADVEALTQLETLLCLKKIVFL